VNVDECTASCGEAPGEWDDVLVCYNDAVGADGACYDDCSDACDLCVDGECGDEVSACVADTDCSCWSNCWDGENDAECETQCGAAPMIWNDLLVCYVGAVGPGGTCEMVCEEP
jgi:hypothetical protein